MCCTVLVISHNCKEYAQDYTNDVSGSVGGLIYERQIIMLRCSVIGALALKFIRLGPKTKEGSLKLALSVFQGSPYKLYSSWHQPYISSKLTLGRRRYRPKIVI